MPLRIDLFHYTEEVDAFSKMASGFLAAGAGKAVSDAVSSLQTPVRGGVDRIPWETPKARPIPFRMSKSYDGANSNDEPLFLTFAFDCIFSRPVNTHRPRPERSFWNVERAVTHFRWCDGAGNEKMASHFDLKNTGQLGPEYHYQVAENRNRLAIPRLPSVCFLPTDCLDFALAELHPREWPQYQATKQYERDLVRRAQRARLAYSASEVTRFWDTTQSVQTPISALQRFTSRRPFTLPSHKP